MPKRSDLFVAALENGRVDRVFGVPGEENLDILDSLHASHGAHPAAVLQHADGQGRRRWRLQPLRGDRRALGVIGDIGASVEGLEVRLEGRVSPDAGMPELRWRILARINDRAEEDRFPVTPQRLVDDVREIMPEDGIVCLDNGIYKIWFARNYRTHVANTLLLDNALITMGAGRPSAMMADMLHPARRVMAVCRWRVHDELADPAARGRPGRGLDRGGYDDLDDAIRRASALPTAFQASSFAQDMDVAMRATNRLDVPAVMINDPAAFRTDWRPFAGRWESGYGTGGIPCNMRDMTQEKMILMRKS